jgi:hypothetical protein
MFGFSLRLEPFRNQSICFNYHPFDPPKTNETQCLASPRLAQLVLPQREKKKETTKKDI